MPVIVLAEYTRSTFRTKPANLLFGRVSTRHAPGRLVENHRYRFIQAMILSDYSTNSAQ